VAPARWRHIGGFGYEIGAAGSAGALVMLDRGVRQSTIRGMGFNRRKMEDQRREAAAKEAARAAVAHQHRR